MKRSAVFSGLMVVIALIASGCQKEGQGMTPATPPANSQPTNVSVTNSGYLPRLQVTLVSHMKQIVNLDCHYRILSDRQEVINDRESVLVQLFPAQNSLVWKALYTNIKTQSRIMRSRGSNTIAVSLNPRPGSDAMRVREGENLIHYVHQTCKFPGYNNGGCPEWITQERGFITLDVAVVRVQDPGIEDRKPNNCWFRKIFN